MFSKMNKVSLFLGLTGSLLVALSLSLSTSAAQITKPTARSSATTLPQVLRYSPLPCVAPGSVINLSVKNLGPLTSAQQTYSLAIEVQGSKQPIEYSRKNQTILIARLPKLSNESKTIRIGFLPDKHWQKNALEITICSANHSQRTASSLRQSSARSDQPADSETNSDKPDTREPDTRNPGTQKPDTRKPDTDKPDPSTGEADDDLRQRIANRQTEGSLIGSGLPNLPAELRLKKRKDASSYVSNELVAVSADIDQAKQLAQIMSGYQARAVRRKTMKSLGMVLTTFRLSPGYTVNQILEELRTSNPEIWIDANHFYFPSATATAKEKTSTKPHRRTGLFNSIGKKPNNQCNNKVKIGILDGPVDQTVESLTTQSIVQKQMFSRGKKAASTNHATAIASLLVGNSNYPELAGVISHADLAVGVVMQAQSDDKKKIFSTTENLILGLNWLVEQQVDVINLSLGGPRNALLEIALTKVLELDIGIVAAAGNSGSKKEKSYPAAQTGIIAVSAVDSDKNLAEDATQGDYIEISAPGVDLWVASNQSSGHYLSGSSLAAPLVAAALAQLGGSPKQSNLLFNSSKDLGQPGKDPKFGWGLLQFPPCKN
jgi:hypothetical protein